MILPFYSLFSSLESDIELQLFSLNYFYTKNISSFLVFYFTSFHEHCKWEFVLKQTDAEICLILNDWF